MGLIPSYVVLPEKGFVRTELIVNCIIISIVLTVVGLRVFVRVTGAGLGLDDAFILLAAPLGVGMLVCQGFLMKVGSGYDLASNPELIANAPFILLMSYCMEIIYVICLASAKTSMLVFYLRVFSTAMMRKGVRIVLVFLAAWTFCFECACIFLCSPPSAFWTQQGKCGKFVPMIQALIATNAVFDLVVMSMPMPVIWSLQMRTTEKLGIMSCFALGLACVVIAVFRVIYLAKVDLASNITGTMPTTVFLFALEPNLAVLCVSIPMLRPLYSRYKSRNASSRLKDNSGSGGLTSGSKGVGIRTIGMISHATGRKKRSNNDTLNSTTWEMDEYYSNNAVKGMVHSAAVVDAGHDADETGSEKCLTNEGHPLPGDRIGVHTEWKVTSQNL